uniref:DUF5678 domain-containing protein n=1 Tax=Angiostrongylus cantonensis TaxID=6313 RepID=A0A0K0DA87_ANGCA
MFSGKKVKWNHFGKKYSFRISDYEMEYANLYDALMKKVHEARPDFEGAIAFIDHLGRQVVVNSDKTVRDALGQAKGKLKLHTTLIDGQIVSAAELAGRTTRSHSVPPTAVSLRSFTTTYHSFIRDRLFAISALNHLQLSAFLQSVSVVMINDSIGG